MDTQLKKVNRRKRISYLSSIVSIAMVLLMLGLFGLIYIQSTQLNNLIKENILVNVYLSDDINQSEIDQNLANIKKMPSVKDTKFISKDVAAMDLSKEMGQDIVEFAGYNPLPASIEITLKAESISNETMQLFKNTLQQMPKVAEVKYNEIIFGNVGTNLGSLSYILMGLALIFIIIAIVLINSNIRLNLFARRFSIKSMQLVGATHWFIIKPFVIRSFFNGLYGGILAVALLLLVLNILPTYFPQIQYLYNTQSFMLLFVILILAGVLVSMVSSWLSTNKYLKTKIEDLY
ncbi:MAG: cell division protein FtsX [Candidatus Methylacidiphilales bacterium]